MQQVDDNPESSADPSGLPTVGQLLKAGRAKRDLSLENVSAELRMEAHVLEALESDRFEVLGAPVFVKGYLKRYGAMIGLSYDDLMAAYSRSADTGDVDIKPRLSIHLRDDRQIMFWVISILAVLLLLVFGFVWWISGPANLGLPGFGSNESQEPADRSVSASQPAAASSARPSSTAAGMPVSNTPALQRSGPALTGPATAVNERAPAPPSRTESLSSGALSSETVASEPAPESPASEALTSEAPDAAASPPVAAAVGPAEQADSSAEGDGAVPEGLVALDIVFVEDSWTDITDARGVRVYYDLGLSGTEARVFAEPPLNVLLGNAAGVRMSLDGEPVSVPASNRRDNLANFIVEAGNN